MTRAFPHRAVTTVQAPLLRHVFRLWREADAGTWITDRLDLRKQTGLVLTASAVLAGASIWLFFGISQDVGAHEEFALVDPAVRSWCSAHRLPWLTSLDAVLERLSEPYVLSVALLVASSIVARRVRSWWPLLTAVAVIFWSAVLWVVAGCGTGPGCGHPVSAAISGDPSGHVAMFVVSSGLLGALLGHRRSMLRRTALLAAAGLVSLVMAGLRVYVGTASLADTLVGIAFGIGILALASIARVAFLGPDTSQDAVATPEARPQATSRT